MDVVDRSQTWFWSPDWQQAEKEVSDDVEAGRIRTFDTAEQAIEALQSFEDDTP